MSGHKFYNNFTGGEWTPKLDARSDLGRYDSAARTMENVRVMLYGGFRMRPGFEYKAECYLGSFGGAGLKTFLVPFQFSTTTRFMLMFSHRLIFFVSDGALVPRASTTLWALILGYAVDDIVERVLPSGASTYWKCIQTVPGQTLPSTNPFPEDTPAYWSAATDIEWALSIASPYDAFSTFALQYRQINDVMYLTHPDYPVHKLSRLSDTSWTIAEVDWTYPPFQDENIGATTVTSDGLTGSVTLTASADLWTSDHVGAYWEIRHLREANSAVVNVSGSSGSLNSSTLDVKGDWTITTSGYWYGVLELERSEDGGSTWDTIRKFEGQSDRNVSASGNQTLEAKLRLKYTATGNPFGSGVWAGTAPTDYVKAKATLDSQEAYVGGFVKITAFTSATEVDATVMDTLKSTAATKIWAEGAFSAKRGYPRALALYEQRIYYAGTSDNPIGIWGSKTGDFENYSYGVNDDSAIAFSVAATEANIVQWMEGLDVILSGTSGGEFAVSSGSPQSEPITPTTVNIRGQSNYGSSAIQAKAINDVVLFVHRQGKRIHEMAYSLERDRYVAPDLTDLAEHILAGGVVQMAFARLPDPTLYVVTGDGYLAVFTYDRAQNVTAWTRWTTDGLFESVQTLHGSPEDEVWVVVKRTIDGTVYRYLEKLTAESDVKEDAVLLDSAATGTANSLTVSGLDHLEGETVGAVLNGAYLGTYVVASGAITMRQATQFGKYVIGLPYTGTVKTMKLDVMMQDGSGQGRMRRITKAVIKFRNTLGCKFGRVLGSLDEVNFRDVGNNMDESPPLFTGDKAVEWPRGYDREGNIIIQQDKPLPCTVLGIEVKYDFLGD